MKAKRPKIMLMANRSMVKKKVMDEFLTGSESVKDSQRKHPTRWGRSLLKGAAVSKGRALFLQSRADQLQILLAHDRLELPSEAARSPSPEPLFDDDGEQLNTREVRTREKFDIERREAIAEASRLNPKYTTPAGWKAVTKESKVFFPVKDYPEHDFVAVLRGGVLKKIEQACNVKLVLRGKGVKEKKTKKDAKPAEGGDEELHVSITADTLTALEAAEVALEAHFIPPPEPEPEPEPEPPVAPTPPPAAPVDQAHTQPRPGRAVFPPPGGPPVGSAGARGGPPPGPGGPPAGPGGAAMGMMRPQGPVSGGLPPGASQSPYMHGATLPSGQPMASPAARPPLRPTHATLVSTLPSGHHASTANHHHLGPAYATSRSSIALLGPAYAPLGPAHASPRTSTTPLRRARALFRPAAAFPWATASLRRTNAQATNGSADDAAT
ncbi:hypothetical protein CYMTET_14150 [Cymbomonas tetramitiformis]|uniref:Branchpoint-bridging protein n=1 Tax=Cymbomonas tetramitiformis TaxID=36881 RepID=A0AAE0GH53_9CHLO|nr:hypothetical protein CYMTET_14150 [Cymbomonas tetramitiformis]